MHKDNDTRRRVVFYYDVYHLLHEVENITAALASRPDSGGNRREWLIFNVDSEELFRRFAKDAMAEIRARIYRWIDGEHPSEDCRKEDRMHLHTLINRDDSCGQPAVIRVIDDKIREYLISRTIYQWYLLKATEEAQQPYVRSEQLLGDIKGLFVASDPPVRKKYNIF